MNPHGPVLLAASLLLAPPLVAVVRAAPDIANLTVGAVGDDLALIWTPDAGPIEGYRVYRSSNLGCRPFQVIYKGPAAGFSAIGALLPSSGAELYWVETFDGADRGTPSAPVYRISVDIEIGNNVVALPARLGPLPTRTSELCAMVNRLLPLVAEIQDLAPDSGATRSYVCGSGTGDFDLTPGRAVTLVARSAGTISVWGHNHPDDPLMLDEIAGPGDIGTYHLSLPHDHRYSSLTQLAGELADAVEIGVWDTPSASFLGVTRGAPGMAWSGLDVALDSRRTAGLRVRVARPSSFTPRRICSAACVPAELVSLAPLLAVRAADDVAIRFNIELTSAGYELVRVDRKDRLEMIAGEPPYLSIMGNQPAFPVIDPGAVSATELYFYQARGVCAMLSCTLGTDTDLDRLDDCYETASGLFAGVTDTGTDPSNRDTDGDGIEDGDEVLGTLGGLDLPALGADPLRKSVFIEYDWFDDSTGTCGPHTHRPNSSIAARVSQAFAVAPVPNPDGSTGVSFIHDYGQGGPFSGGNYIADADAVLDQGVSGSDFIGYKALDFAPQRENYFHYTILPHRYNRTSSSSGQAEIAGDDLIVSLRTCITAPDHTSDYANTIVHEIGHNFTLRHGGYHNCNRKPNYNSVMNYNYQFPGVDTDCTPPGNGLLDYSHGRNAPLDENDLDETIGVCGGVRWDWDNDTVIEASVAYDLNRSGPAATPDNTDCGGVLTVLEDYDDWLNINYGAVIDGDFSGRPVEVIDCQESPGD